MKRDEKLNQLLHDLLPEDDTQGGPGLPEVLDLAAQQRVRRRNRQRAAVAAGCAAIAILFGVWFSQSRTADDPTPILATEHEESHGFSQIDDTELVNLIDGAPMAFIEWPDGRRTLLVVEY